jgi:hypothetical protein
MHAEQATNAHTQRPSPDSPAAQTKQKTHILNISTDCTLAADVKYKIYKGRFLISTQKAKVAAFKAGISLGQARDNFQMYTLYFFAH